MSATPRQQHRWRDVRQVVEQLVDADVLQLLKCAVGVPLPTAAPVGRPRRRPER